MANRSHRLFAFDKRTGETVWVSTPGGRPYDTSYSNPIIMEVEGTRLLVMGLGDGSLVAVKPQTGEPVWQSGMAMNKSTANDIWLFGAGPFQKGTIYDETRFAGLVKKKELEEGAKASVEVEAEAVFAGATPKVKEQSGVVQASAEMPPEAAGGPPVLPPPARPIAEAPKPAEAKEDPATTAG